MKRQDIDNVVFDLGGVVIDLERERCIEAFEELGYADITKDLDLYVQRGAFYGLECGHITAAGFFDIMRPLCPKARGDKDIQDAFNQFLRRLPVERLEALRKLRRSRRVLALSNTNPVMYHSWIDKAFRQQGMAIDDYFDGVVASFREGCCKPDPRIFSILVNRYGLNPARTLYLDDSEANCRSARECGLLSKQITPEFDMLAAIDFLLD